MTKPETKEQHTSSILCKCPSCIRKAEMGYAQALEDVKDLLTSMPPIDANLRILKCLKGIQALKNHNPSPELQLRDRKSGSCVKPRIATRQEVTPPDVEDKTSHPHGDLCQCGHEREEHYFGRTYPWNNAPASQSYADGRPRSGVPATRGSCVSPKAKAHGFVGAGTL